MNSFIVEIYNKQTVSTDTVEVTISGGAYSININGVYSGKMVSNNSQPSGYFTTDKIVEPYLEAIANELKIRKNKISIRELLTAVIGILQLISFLFGTVVLFKLKETMHKTRIFLLINILPFFFECAAIDYIGLTNL